MPIEIRRIDFSEIELRQALAFYLSKKEGGSDHEGRVGSMKVMGGDELSVAAKVSTASGGDVERRVFDHATVLTAMVLFAKRAKVLLPKYGKKVVSPGAMNGVYMTVKYKHHVLEQAPMKSSG